MVQEGLRKRLILPGGQYPDHVLHSFAGPAPPLPFHAIAVEPVIRFCSTQVDFCMDAALAQAWDIGSLSLQIASIESLDSLMREMTAPIAFSLQISPVFVIISMRKALSLFYLCTEIITFPLKGRLSSFIVSGKISLPSKILH